MRQSLKIGPNNTIYVDRAMRDVFGTDTLTAILNGVVVVLFSDKQDVNKVVKSLEATIHEINVEVNE